MLDHYKQKTADLSLKATLVPRVKLLVFKLGDHLAMSVLKLAFLLLFH